MECCCWQPLRSWRCFNYCKFLLSFLLNTCVELSKMKYNVGLILVYLTVETSCYIMILYLLFSQKWILCWQQLLADCDVFLAHISTALADYLPKTLTMSIIVSKLLPFWTFVDEVTSSLIYLLSNKAIKTKCKVPGKSFELLKGHI